MASGFPWARKERGLECDGGARAGRPLVPGCLAVSTPFPEALPSDLGASGYRCWSVWVM